MYMSMAGISGVVITVFDDGDECTLRRSSLCLQGARHFKESQVQPQCMTTVYMHCNNQLCSAHRVFI